MEKVKIPKALSKGEETLALQLRIENIPFVREVQFCARKWKLDFILTPNHQGSHIAIEVDGGTSWGKSRHSYGEGYENDCDKLNTATMLGYRVLRFTTRQVVCGEAIEFIRKSIRT